MALWDIFTELKVLQPVIFLMAHTKIPTRPRLLISVDKSSGSEGADHYVEDGACICVLHLRKAAAMVTRHHSFNLELANYFFQHFCFAHPEEARELFSDSCVYGCVCVW